MAKINSKLTFTVYARVISFVETQIMGEANMEAAMAFAKTLKAEDFVTTNDDCSALDTSLEITGVTNKHHYNTDIY